MNPALLLINQAGSKEIGCGFIFRTYASNLQKFLHPWVY